MELIAIYEALKLSYLKLLLFYQFKIISDSKIAIHYIMDKYSGLNLPYTPLVLECKRLFFDKEQIQLIHLSESYESLQRYHIIAHDLSEMYLKRKK